MPAKGTIKKEQEKHWHVETLNVSGDPNKDRTVVWECTEEPGHEFVVLFPSHRNPLHGPHEVYSDRGVATAKVKTYDGQVTKGAKFHYCVLMIAKDREDSVVGTSSPPTMVIE